jgi:hypothetical protein
VHFHILQKQCVTIKLDAVTETYSRSTLEMSLTVVVLAVGIAVAVMVVVDVVVDMAVAAGIVSSAAGIEGGAGTVVVVGNVADCNVADVGTGVDTVADHNAVAVGNCVDMVAAVADNTVGVVVEIACTTVVGDREDPTVQVLLVAQNDGCVGVSVLNCCNTHFLHRSTSRCLVQLG